MTPDQRAALRNIKAVRNNLRRFESIAPPELWADLNVAVNRHEDRVRAHNNLPPRTKR